LEEKISVPSKQSSTEGLIGYMYKSVFLSAFVLLGCLSNVKNEKETNKVGHGFGPFRTGNVWVYKYKQDIDSIQEWSRKVELTDRGYSTENKTVHFKITDSFPNGSKKESVDSLTEGYHKKGCTPVFRHCPVSAWYPDQIEDSVTRYLEIENGGIKYKIYLQNCVYSQVERGTTVGSENSYGFVDTAIGLLSRHASIGGNPFTVDPCNKKKCYIDIKLIEYNGEKLNIEDVIQQVDTSITKPNLKPSCFNFLISQYTFGTCV